MNDDRLNELFRGARSVKPDTTRAEYGFEARLLSRLRTERKEFIPWYGLAWRLIPALVAIVAAAGLWVIAAPNRSRADIRNAIADDEGDRTLVSFFTGE